MNVLITGSSGLIGSESVRHFNALGAGVFGIDNNMRADFFGPQGDTTGMLRELQETCSHFQHLALDIRDRSAITRTVQQTRPNLVVHCAAQPSHDLARSRPLDDFDVNAVGTLNLLEATRLHAPEAVFIFMSTNKVYGDAPNERPLVELATRYDYADPAHQRGIDENCRIDRSLHSLLGASKVAADILTQEYARSFGMKTIVFRGGCLTGSGQSAVQLHGFLAYLVRQAVRGEPYTIIGYQGKQVRDQLHGVDVARAFEAVFRDPRPGEVYNLGGGRNNSASVLELLDRLEQLLGRRIPRRYIEEPRLGDHIVYITDLTKFQTHYPGWRPTYDLDDIVADVLNKEPACQLSPEKVR